LRPVAVIVLVPLLTIYGLLRRNGLLRRRGLLWKSGLLPGAANLVPENSLRVPLIVLEAVRCCGIGVLPCPGGLPRIGRPICAFLTGPVGGIGVLVIIVLVILSMNGIEWQKEPIEHSDT